MAKSLLLSRLTQVRISYCGFCILCYIAVAHLFYFKPFYNSALLLSSIDKHIFKEVTPYLLLKKNISECNYKDVLKRSLRVSQIPTKYNDFSPTEIVNGTYVPSHCNPQISVAIIVTYRKRESQLYVFLHYMHSFLRKQNIHYKIYIIEQQDETPFNRGLLFNIGAKQAMADKFPCLILHDVDLLPQDEGNVYACLQQPRHFSSSIDKFRYVPRYPELVGGVLGIRSDQFAAVNGFSNRFRGWGGEDDDLHYRLVDHGLRVLRLPPHVSHYTMIPHKPQPVPKQMRQVLEKNRVDPAAAADGFRHLHYKTLRVQPYELYTLVGVRF